MATRDPRAILGVGLVAGLTSVAWDEMDALLLRLEEMPDADEPLVPAPPDGTRLASPPSE